MFPILRIGSVEISAYATTYILAIALGVFAGRKLAVRAGLKGGDFFDALLTAVVFGYFGSVIYNFIARHFLVEGRSHLPLGEALKSGTAWYGAPIVGIPVFIWCCRRFGLKVWPALDCAAAAIALGQFIGRLGCFAAGCCYGKPTDSMLGVSFSAETLPPELHNVPLHPSQLYEAFAVLLLFVWLVLRFPRRRFDGELFLTYLLAYPVLRFFIEFYRGDEIRGAVAGGMLSTSQAVSIIIFVIGAALLYSRRATLPENAR